MNIYLLKKKSDPYYDEVRCFVIVEKTAKAARGMAARNCGDEGPEVWKLSEKSTCSNVGVANIHAIDGPTILCRDCWEA